MAREILFKAKEKHDGDWIQGFLSMSEGEYVICGKDGVGLFIDESTICQYTGLTDKNGNKIWENDVCACKKRGCAFFGCVVKWNQVNARFDVNAMSCDFSMTLEECIDGVSINGLDYEVIGNIFDNPELLGGADNG